MTEARATGNRNLWGALSLALAAVLCNALFFVSIPGQRVIPWISLALAAIALFLVIRGVQHMFAGSRPRGKIVGWVLAVFSLLLVAFTAFSFVAAHSLPNVAGVPKVGDKLADFTLSNSSGQPVSLSQMFVSDGNRPPPKAVMLVFYRGYW